MVWRNNIKVLEMKAKTLPLVISMSLHGIMLFAFVIAGHEKERVFTVELAFNDTAYNMLSKKKGLNHKAVERHEKRTDISNSDTKRENTVAQSVKRHESLSQRVDVKDISDATDMDKGYETSSPILKDSTAVSKNGGSKIIAKSNSSGNNVTEGEFGSINNPSFLRMIKPEYPRMARRLGKEGKVVLRLFIDEHGRLVSVEIIEKAGYGFDEAVVDAVKASTFRPAKLNGHPVACKAVLPVRFRLE